MPQRLLGVPMPVMMPGLLNGVVSDPNAAAYIAAVEIADRQELEYTTRQAINDFVIGCKQDGIWNAIKASCILSGARTLSGALIPLTGAAPTNFNFVSGDYNRKTGLVGNGSSKYLNSNRNNNADPQNNNHLAVYHNSNASGVSAIAGNSDANGTTQLIALPNPQTKSRNFSGVNHGGAALGVGFFGISRSASSTYQWRATNGNVGGYITQASQIPNSSSVFLFARAATSGFPTGSRLAFYSIGESLDLALLDIRVTTLLNTFADVIP